MIPNQWYVVLESKDVRSTPLGVQRLGERLVFWRSPGGQVHAAVDTCPHRGVELSLGQVKDGHLQCPFHGFEFDPSGKCVLAPANGRNGVVPAALHLHSRPTYEAYGLIWVWWGDRPPQAGEEPLFFDNLKQQDFYTASTYDPWDIHYSRVIENQLDVAHLPFLHWNTIGRGNRTLVDGPLMEWKGERMIVTYVFNRVDDGSRPRKPAELAPKGPTGVHLEFIFPNLWQNYISEKVRILAAFIPVDEQHTLLLMRYYQKALRAPILGSLVAKAMIPAAVYIAHQDRRVVVTHQPNASGLKTGEILIPADLPIIAYRKKRAALQAQAQAAAKPVQESQAPG